MSTVHMCHVHDMSFSKVTVMRYSSVRRCVASSAIGHGLWDVGTVSLGDAAQRPHDYSRVRVAPGAPWAYRSARYVCLLTKHAKLHLVPR